LAELVDKLGIFDKVGVTGVGAVYKLKERAHNGLKGIINGS
jgi:hypothetical protein